MANRIKEEEKNEKIIRGLLKLPENKRCINCNNPGPQYVCTNFWIFICTNCSGIHREFTHRVKSVSMAKFTSQEVTALQEGGNERARQIYLKEWDPQHHSFPDSSNIDKLRDFIKHVFVDRRYSGERNADRPQRMKSDREEYNDNRRAESYRGGSRSPPYEDHYSDRPGSGGRNDDRSSKYNFGDRSPGYDRGDYKRSPARLEVIDARRNDRFGNGSQNQRTEEHKFPDFPKPDGRPSDYKNDVDGSSPPMVRPVRDILGDNVPRLQVGEPSNPNGKKSSDHSEPTKNNLPLSNPSSSNAKPVASLGSLIDFSGEPEPSTAAVPQHPIPQQAASSGGDWASFDMSGQQKVSQVAGNANTLESALAGLSISGSASAGNIPTVPVSKNYAPINANSAGQPAVQHQNTSLFLVDNLSVNPPSNVPVGASSNQVMGSSSAPYVQGSLPAQAVGSAGHLTRVATKPPQGVSDGSSSQPNSAESKSAGRKELPVDFFTSLYQPAPMPAPGWQRGPYVPVAYGVQYPTGMAAAAFHQSQSPKSVNPFDFTSEPAATFPSMATLQGALPNMTYPATLQQSANFRAMSPQWVSPQQYSYNPSRSPSPFMVQQVPSNSQQQVPSNMIPMGHLSLASSGNNGPALGTSDMDQHSATRFSIPNAPNSFGSVGGNPFG